MKFHHIALVSAFLACVGCAAGDEVSTSSDDVTNAEAPLARFSPHIKSLREMIERPATVEEAANSLLGAGRPACFSLQGLSRVYKHSNQDFKQLEVDFKALEDGIGAYDKWNGIYSTAVSQNSPADTLARLKQQRDAALARFTAQLTQGRWRVEAGQKSRLDEIDEFLKGAGWQSRTKDRAAVLDSLLDELKDLNETRYDMSHLEEGNGLHELRRDIRWVLLEQRDLRGMIVYKSGDACPIPAYANLSQDPIAQGRFSRLDPSPLEPKPCEVSKCVVLAAAKTVEDIGAIKDQVETGNNIQGDSDEVPEAFRAQVNAIYQGITDNNLLGVYIDELKACKSAR